MKHSVDNVSEKWGKMGGVLSNMLKHLKEECSNISEELRNILYDSDNIIIRQKKNKRSRVEAELSDDDNDENATHHNMQKTMDKSIPSNEMTAIRQQILRALLSANVPFSFAYKEVGMEFETDKWIGFVSDNGSDMVKAQRLMREDLEIGGKFLLIITESKFNSSVSMHYTLATFSKAAETILSLKDDIRVMAITHSDLLITKHFMLY
ncbi:unnamed protein product [Rhizophagus irregularis]|nr:unnamed protein product [Rhizophagus irregularis]